MNYRNLPKIQYSKIEHRRKVVKAHTHTYYELYYLLRGETAYFIGDEIFKLYPGDFILVPKGSIHATDSQSCLHNERLLVTFDDDIFDERTLPYLTELCNVKLIRIKEGKAHIFDELMQKLQKEPDTASPLGILYVLELILLLSKHKSSSAQSNAKHNEYISEITKYIRENYAEDITLAGLSRKFGISESALSRKFKQEVGIGLWEFITQVRIFNAETVLMQKDISITEAARLCGFSDSNYFATVFKKAKGITPLKYKKSNVR
jgi:YesN/AraC family two-component response regulator